ncbi:MAG: biotin--[acetyl-CoA-carboxylase] ligase [Chloroflexi bacterium]|nr:biotin--[acetyl-CoA-carboxylase] ligase [Chloroflexota bacterium]
MNKLGTPIIEWFVPARQIGKHVLLYQEVTSTMDAAWDALEQGSPDGMAIAALEQSKGRGRFDRAWVSEPGDALMLSVLLYPDAASAQKLSMIAGVAVVKAVRDLTDAECAIKWPNDVRIDGKKVCGILTEVRASTSGEIKAVVGMGLNLDLDIEHHPELRDSATSLLAETGQRITVTEAAHAVMQAFDETYTHTVAGDDVVAEWRGLLDTLGRRITVRLADGEATGIAEDVTDAGSLLLRQDDGTTLELTAGEVTLQT